MESTIPRWSSRLLGALASGRWLGPRQFVVICACLIASEILGLLRNPSIGTDFSGFWAVSRAALSGRLHIVYSPADLHQLRQLWTGDVSTRYLPWLYPPHSLLVVYPLAWIPLRASLILALAAGLAAYVAAVTYASGDGWRAALASLAFPPVALNIAYGNGGFVTGALFAWGLSALPSRPVLAGIFFGVLTFKPHLGILVPVALAAGARWRALASAASTCGAMAIGTTLIFGTGVWRGWFASFGVARDALEHGWMGYEQLSSPFGAVRLAGGSLRLAYAVQGVVAIAAAGAIARLWRSAHVRDDLKAAALATGALLATPYAYPYDLTVLGVGLAFAVRHSLRDGWLDWERTTFVFVAVLTVFIRPLAAATGVSPGPLIVLAPMLLILRRASSAPATTTPT